jgi:uncharacterized OsmC-like protein
MSEDRTHHVNVKLVTKYQFTAEFPDVASTPTILVDEAPPLGDGRAPNPAALLGAAVGSCMSATLASCLRRAHVEVDALTANVATHVSRNEHGRYRLTGIDVELVPNFPPNGRIALDRCERIFEDYCIVTASVREGIPVTLSLKKPEPDSGGVREGIEALPG